MITSPALAQLLIEAMENVVKQAPHQLLKVLAVAGPLLLLSACGGGAGDADNVIPDGGSGGNGGGTNMPPVGLNCSTSGALDTCAETQRIGALTQSFNRLVSTVYGARYSKASLATHSGNPQACPGGGTYSGSVLSATSVQLSFNNCVAPAGTLTGTATVSRQSVDVVTSDNDRIALDLTIGGERYVGTVSAQHRTLSGKELLTVGLASVLTLTPQNGVALTVNSFGVSMTEQADGSYREAGDLSLSAINAAGASMALLSGSTRASYFKTETGGTGLFVSFDAPDDGALKYLRTVPGQVTVNGTVTAQGTQFSAQLASGGSQFSAAGTWSAAEAVALYAAN